MKALMLVKFVTQKEFRMVYQGSKNRISKYLIPIIEEYIEKYNIDTYIELFCGGCNLIDKVNCKHKIASDFNEDLIVLLKYAQKDNALSIAPAECSFEHYADVRADRNHIKYSHEYRALIGYMASYGGRYFDGGYGRDSKGGRTIYSERLNNFKAQAPLLNDIDISCRDYKTIDVSKYHNCLFYLDPPYRDTKHYAKNVIDYDEFYDFCEQLAKDNVVLISEYSMPEDRFECIWSKNVKCLQKSDRTTGDDRTEKLFLCKGRV